MVRFVNAAPITRLASTAWERLTTTVDGIPLMLTETSVDGKPINREIWLDTTLDHIRRLREAGHSDVGDDLVADDRPARLGRRGSRTELARFTMSGSTR